MQVLKSSHQRNTVQRQGAVTMGSKPTTTAGEHYYFFITFLDIRNQTCFTTKYMSYVTVLSPQISIIVCLRKCQYAVLGLSQMEAHKYRHLNE